jgi:hypothetical protein
MNQDERIDDEMREEYNFSRGARGKYAAAYAQGTIVVLLDSVLANVFRDSATVNRALREYLAEHGEPPRKVG